MRRFLMALALCAGLFLVEAQAQGQFNFKPGRLEDQASIGKALAAIPFNDRTMGYRSLGERIERLGLNVARIEVERLTADDARDDPAHFRRGDMLLTISAAEAAAPVRALCPVGQRFQLVKRGLRWIPQDRTSNWLINGHGHCQAPA
jgi:hypothetical protein